MHFLSSVLIVLCLASCEAQQIMTPEQQAEVQQLEQVVQDKNTSLEEKEKIGQAILSVIKDKVADAEPIDVELEQLTVLQKQYDEDLQEMESAIAEVNKKYSAAIEERTAGIGGVVRALPVVGPYAEFVLPLLPLLFRRPREAVAKGVKGAAKGKFFDLLMAIPRMYGIAHSSGKPEEIAEAAVMVAKKKNRPELAARIETALKGTI